jgi:hypothetical protein
MEGSQSLSWQNRLVGVRIQLSLGQMVEQIPISNPVCPCRHIVVPDRFLKREYQIDICGCQIQGSIGEYLEQELFPVVLEHSCGFHLKDLGRRLGIRMAFDRVIGNYSVKGKGAFDNRI